MKKLFTVLATLVVLGILGFTTNSNQQNSSPVAKTNSSELGTSKINEGQF